MPDSETDQLESLLDDILANDVQIRRGADAAGLDLDVLREQVLRRPDEVQEACRGEQNLVKEIESELRILDYRRSEARRRARRIFSIPKYAAWVLLAIATGYMLVWLADAFGWYSPLPWVTRTGGLIGPLVIVLVAAGLLLVYWSLNSWLNRAFNPAGQSFSYQFLQEQREAAKEALSEALREKGIRAMLREIINVEDPSYLQTLQVDQAAGLAELRDPLYEIKTKAKERIQDLLTAMPGGSIGVSGPRGVGKTTLLRYFCSPRLGRPPAGGRPDLRVLISAPVQYEARDFVLHLFSAVCQAVLGPEETARVVREGWRPPRERRRQPFLTLALVVGIILAILLPLYGIVLLLSVIFDWKLNPNLAPGVLLVVLGLGLLEAFRRILSDAARQVGAAVAGLSVFGVSIMFDSSDESSKLQDTARAFLLGLTYQQTFAQGWTGAVKLPVGLEGGLSSTTTMMDRPISYPEVVARLSDFLKQVSMSYRVLIGIDEMDKIESDELANQFLNDLKAVFGLENCFWLVSVSQSAMSAFERRGLPFRDVFDSSFDVIIEVDYLNLAASKRLLQRRAIGMPVPFLCLCHCLAGGLPRDLIRVARELLELSRADKASKELPDLACALVAGELDRKRRAVAVAATAVGLEPWTGRFLAAIEGTRTAATAGSLLVACRAPSDDTDSEIDKSDKAVEARSRLAQLRAELSGYFYYTATLLEFFNANLTEERLRAAEIPKDGPATIDQLARARQAFMVSPRVAWGAISTVRQAWAMEVLPFPDAAASTAVPNESGAAVTPMPRVATE